MDVVLIIGFACTYFHLSLSYLYVHFINKARNVIMAGGKSLFVCKYWPRSDSTVGVHRTELETDRSE